MPPRPFPYALRIGNDICNVARIRAIIAGRDDGTTTSLQPLSRFVRRILTPPERTYFWHRFGPEQAMHTKLDTISQFLAGRFAAKEACRKACPHLPSTTRGFQHIVILPVALPPPREEHPSLRPRGLILDAAFHASAACARGAVVPASDASDESAAGALEGLDGQLCEISISHEEGGYATAVALVPEMQRTAGGGNATS